MDKSLLLRQRQASGQYHVPTTKQVSPGFVHDTQTRRRHQQHLILTDETMQHRRRWIGKLLSTSRRPSQETSSPSTAPIIDITVTTNRNEFQPTFETENFLETITVPRNTPVSNRMAENMHDDRDQLKDLMELVGSACDTTPKRSSASETSTVSSSVTHDTNESDEEPPSLSRRRMSGSSRQTPVLGDSQFTSSRRSSVRSPPPLTRKVKSGDSFPVNSSHMLSMGRLRNGEPFRVSPSHMGSVVRGEGSMGSPIQRKLVGRKSVGRSTSPFAPDSPTSASLRSLKSLRDSPATVAAIEYSSRRKIRSPLMWTRKEKEATVDYSRSPVIVARSSGNSAEIETPLRTEREGTESSQRMNSFRRVLGRSISPSRASTYKRNNRRVRSNVQRQAASLSPRNRSRKKQMLNERITTTYQNGRSVVEEEQEETRTHVSRSSSHRTHRSSRSHSTDSVQRSSRSQSRDSAHRSSRSQSRDSARRSSRSQSKDPGRRSSRSHSKDSTRRSTRSHSRDSTRRSTRSPTKESGDKHRCLSKPRKAKDEKVYFYEDSSESDTSSLDDFYESPYERMDRYRDESSEDDCSVASRGSTESLTDILRSFSDVYSFGDPDFVDKPKGRDQTPSSPYVNNPCQGLSWLPRYMNPVTPCQETSWLNYLFSGGKSAPEKKKSTNDEHNQSEVEETRTPQVDVKVTSASERDSSIKTNEGQTSPKKQDYKRTVSENNDDKSVATTKTSVKKFWNVKKKQDDTKKLKETKPQNQRTKQDAAEKKRNSLTDDKSVNSKKNKKGENKVDITDKIPVKKDAVDEDTNSVKDDSGRPSSPGRYLKSQKEDMIDDNVVMETRESRTGGRPCSPVPRLTSATAAPFATCPSDFGHAMMDRFNDGCGQSALINPNELPVPHCTYETTMPGTGGPSGCGNEMMDTLKQGCGEPTLMDSKSTHETAVPGVTSPPGCGHEQIMDTFNQGCGETSFMNSNVPHCTHEAPVPGFTDPSPFGNDIIDRFKEGCGDAYVDSSTLPVSRRTYAQRIPWTTDSHDEGHEMIWEQGGGDESSLINSIELPGTQGSSTTLDPRVSDSADSGHEMIFDQGGREESALMDSNEAPATKLSSSTTAPGSNDALGHEMVWKQDSRRESIVDSPTLP